MAGHKTVFFGKSPWSVPAGWPLAEAAVQAGPGSPGIQGVRPCLVGG